MADDDLEPIPLAADGPAPPPAGAPAPSATPVLRDRFLVALAVVVGLALIALGFQLRAIAEDAEEDARCTKALVAVVSANFRSSAQERDRIEGHLQDCLGPDAELPGAGES